MNQLQQKNLAHTRKCHGCRQYFSGNDFRYNFKTEDFHCLQCNHHRYTDEGPDKHPKCNGCYQCFPIDELSIHFYHYRYADVVDDTPKTCDFCDTLCDTLDVGKCEDGDWYVCGDCWIRSM